MTMRWTSYLVLHLPEVSTMPDWMQRSHRAEVIMKGYIYPQVEDKLIAEGKANDDNAFDRIIDELTPVVHSMAIQDKHDKIRCEKPIMMWDRLSDLVSETLSTHPTKQEIENLLEMCYNVFYGNFSVNRFDCDMEAELWQTVGALDMLLKHWDENTAQLLRFYSRTSSKTARFARYSI
jgi:hypothetical protein